jgi:hypothetical protein
MEWHGQNGKVLYLSQRTHLEIHRDNRAGAFALHKARQKIPAELNPLLAGM